MREMKDSGISWVGEIPKEWRCLPIRALFTENRNKNFLGRETKALQFKYGTIVPKKNFDPEENYVAETILNYNIVDRGMIMLSCILCFIVFSQTGSRLNMQPPVPTALSPIVLYLL